jgi:hypothetical protein
MFGGLEARLNVSLIPSTSQHRCPDAAFSVRRSMFLFTEGGDINL